MKYFCNIFLIYFYQEILEIYRQMLIFNIFPHIFLTKVAFYPVIVVAMGPMEGTHNSTLGIKTEFRTR